MKKDRTPQFRVMNAVGSVFATIGVLGMTGASPRSSRAALFFAIALAGVVFIVQAIRERP
jgi:hypothetical protein